MAFVSCLAVAGAPLQGSPLQAVTATGAPGLDEETLITLASGREEGLEERFAWACAPCHGADGGGGQLGPSFLDDEWLHGDGLLDIRRVIRFGVEGKAMPSWKDSLGPGEILRLAEHVRSLREKTPVGESELDVR